MDHRSNKNFDRMRARAAFDPERANLFNRRREND